MCYVFVIYFLQPTNCNLTAILFSLAKHATKVLSKLVAASISVICSCTIYFQSRSKCLLQTTQYRESAVYVLLAETDTTLKDAGAVKSHHWFVPKDCDNSPLIDDLWTNDFKVLYFYLKIKVRPYHLDYDLIPFCEISHFLIRSLHYLFHAYIIPFHRI